MCWLIEKKDGFSKLQARKDTELSVRVDFQEMRFIESSGVYTVYMVVIAKPEGCQPLPETKGDKWEPVYPLKAMMQLDSNGSSQEKAAIKALATLDKDAAYSGYLSVLSSPFTDNIVSGNKADGTPLGEDMMAMLMQGIGAFVKVEGGLIKPEDVKAVEKKGNGAKQYKSKAESAVENLAAIQKMLGCDAKGDLLDLAATIDELKCKDTVIALIAAIF